MIGLLFVVSSYSSEKKKILIGTAHFPPYSIYENGVLTGLEVEIARASLERMGYQVQFQNFPYGRLPVSFTNRLVDGTLVTMKNFKGHKVFYTDIVLKEYQTVAVSLDRVNFAGTNFTDFKGKSIIAHQRASIFYGDEYRKAVNHKTSQYSESANQNLQINALYLGRVDVIVLAHQIFLYLKQRSKLNTNQKTRVHKMFGGKRGFHNAFWDENVRNDFNKGLAMIKKDGTYQSILDRFLLTPDVQKVEVLSEQTGKEHRRLSSTAY